MHCKECGLGYPRGRRKCKWFRVTEIIDIFGLMGGFGRAIFRTTYALGGAQDGLC